VDEPLSAFPIRSKVKEFEVTHYRRYLSL
jgi:hypothetical protein